MAKISAVVPCCDKAVVVRSVPAWLLPGFENSPRYSWFRNAVAHVLEASTAFDCEGRPLPKDTWRRNVRTDVLLIISAIDNLLG
jgi:hypothetical protein